MAERIVRITLLQRGPAVASKEETVAANLRLIDEVATEKPDFILLNELSTTPYFCVVRDSRFFDLAETIPGPVTDAFAEKAKRYECHILLPMFEKGELEGIYYNSVAILDPNGRLVSGTLPNGKKVNCMRKVHIPYSEVMTTTGKATIDEAYYFRPGPGFPVFHTSKAVIGVAICYDRRFPESCRTLALQGAEIVFIPNDVPALVPEKGAATEAIFVTELQTRALENLLWVAACNMGGYEVIGKTRTQFFGRSCILHPTGEVIAEGPSTEVAVVTADVDLDAIQKARRLLLCWKYRRPEAYHRLITQAV